MPVETRFIGVVYHRQYHPLRNLEASELSFPIYASCALAEGFPRRELAGHSYGFMTAIIRGAELRRRIAVSVGADTEKRNGCACLSPFCAISCPLLAACRYLSRFLYKSRPGARLISIDCVGRRCSYETAIKALIHVRSNQCLNSAPPFQVAVK